MPPNCPGSGWGFFLAGSGIKGLLNYSAYLLPRADFPFSAQSQAPSVLSHLTGGAFFVACNSNFLAAFIKPPGLFLPAEGTKSH